MVLKRYHSYLLRLWSTDAEGECRVMVEHIGSGERVSLSSLESLVDFLREQAQVENGEAALLHCSVLPDDRETLAEMR